MADKAISELVAAEQIKSTDMFVLEQDGTAKRLQGQTLLNWLTAAADGHGGISNIAKTGTDGLVDTYTITLADTTTKTFTVTNGNGLTNFEKVSTEGLVDNYHFTRTDGTFFDFSVYNGAKGDKGEDSHVWIKYASQQPTADSHSMGDLPDAWMGVYSGTAAEAPDDWQQYTWYQIKGEKGDTGAAATVTGTTVEYMVSDSGTIVPSGSWSTTIPTVPQGKYLWTKVTTTFNTGSPAVSYSVTRMGIDGAGSVSSVNEKSPDESGNVSLSAEDIPTSGGRSVQAVLDDKQEALTAGENISISGSVIATKAFPCNPNLKDNWYFPNPVNQRNGHVVPPKGPGHLYSDAACTLLISGGTIDAYRQVTPVSTGNYSYSIDGGTYYVKASDVVPGYTGIGYTIDRWKLVAWNANSIAMIVEADGVRLIGTSNSSNSAQLQESTQLLSFAAGAVVTASILVTALGANGASPWLFLCKSDGTPIGSSIIESVGLHTFTMVIPDDAGDSVMLAWGQHASFGGVGNTDMTVKAAKLELGSVQTLAHQDANGAWVLNEIPDYGEQLRKCQRYYWRSWRGEKTINTAILGETFPSNQRRRITGFSYPVEMRAKPSITISGTNSVGSVNDWVGDGEIECGAKALYYDNQRCMAVGADIALTDYEYVYYFVEASADL